MSTFVTEKQVKAILTKEHIHNMIKEAQLIDNVNNFNELPIEIKRNLSISIVKQIDLLESICMDDYEFSRDIKYFDELAELIYISMKYVKKSFNPKILSLEDCWVRVKEIYSRWCIEILKENNIISAIDYALHGKTHQFKYFFTESNIIYPFSQYRYFYDVYQQEIPALAFLVNTADPAYEISCTVTGEILKNLHERAEFCLFENMPFIQGYPSNEFNYACNHEIMLEVYDWWHERVERIINECEPYLFRSYEENMKYKYMESEYA